MTIPEKLENLRKLMKEKGLSAYIVPSTDPHSSEYVPERWASRGWISGFTGSAGTIVVTLDSAGLWTDSRYFLQASEQLENSTIDLFKMGLPDTPSMQEWLFDSLNEGDAVGFDGLVFPVAQVNDLKKVFERKNIALNGDYDLIQEVWLNRPSVPLNEVFVHEDIYAGKSRNVKISDIANELKKKNINYNLVTTLDDVAWIFNLRGNDVDFNPVFVAYALISQERATLYIDERKLPFDLKTELDNDNIELKDYVEIEKDLAKISRNSFVLVDSNKVNYRLYNAIKANKIEGKNPSTIMKARKNATEIAGIKNAMQRDGVAMVKFFKWLEDHIGKIEISELSAAAKLLEFREQNELLKGESFNTISGYAGHGAIVHYAANETTNSPLKKEGFYLIDSGGQYLDGTTDITRMVYLGETPNDEEKTDYTMVLKGLINLGLTKYPEGTRGSQLDVLARKFLWDRGMNYLHGTGHGVGCFLNVHEGPQNIRMDENPTVLETGMVTSNEPGIYRAGKHGIRIENLVLTVEDSETEFGKFLKFETLTICPIDIKAIDTNLMTDTEKSWLNDYHSWVYSQLENSLDDEHRAWLKDKTKAI